MKNVLITVFLVCLFATALLGIGAISSGKLDERTIRILTTTAAAAFYSLIGLTCVAQLGNRGDMVGKLGLLFCGGALVHAIYTTWINLKGLDVIQNRLALVVVGIAIGHACLMLLIKPRTDLVTLLVAIAIGSVALNSLLVISSVYTGSFRTLSTMGILGIIATCVTIAAPALNLSQAKT